MVLLTNITPINSINKGLKFESLPCNEVWPPHPLHLSLYLSGADTVPGHRDTTRPKGLKVETALHKAHSSIYSVANDHSPKVTPFLRS